MSMKSSAAAIARGIASSSFSCSARSATRRHGRQLQTLLLAAMGSYSFDARTDRSAYSVGIRATTSIYRPGAMKRKRESESHLKRLLETDGASAVQQLRLPQP